MTESSFVPVAMGLLDASCGGGALPGSLGSELLPWRLSSGRFTSRLLGTSHIFSFKSKNKKYTLITTQCIAFVKNKNMLT